MWVGFQSVLGILRIGFRKKIESKDDQGVNNQNRDIHLVPTFKNWRRIIVQIPFGYIIIFHDRFELLKLFTSLDILVVLCHSFEHKQ